MQLGFQKITRAQDQAQHCDVHHSAGKPRRANGAFKIPWFISRLGLCHAVHRPLLVSPITSAASHCGWGHSR